MASNPYFVFGPRPFREARLRAYIVREHARGRTLEAILRDPYVLRCGSESLVRRVLVDPRTVAAVGRSATEAIVAAMPAGAATERVDA